MQRAVLTRRQVSAAATGTFLGVAIGGQMFGYLLAGEPYTLSFLLFAALAALSTYCVSTRCCLVVEDDYPE